MSMKVKELIEILQGYNQELEVFIPQHSYMGDIFEVEEATASVYRNDELSDKYGKQEILGIMLN